MSKIKVHMLPLQAHCFAFGGFEIQMLELIRALEEQDEIYIRKMNPWDRNSEFDVLHLWGLEQANFNNAYWAKQSKKKVVLTALIGQVETLKEYIRFKVSAKIGNVRFLFNVLNNIDALVVVNELEANKAIKFFKLPKSKVFIIPNLIPRAAVNALNSAAKEVASLKNYFLCAGNISERKNQVMLAKAAHETGLNMVFAGNFICGNSYKETFLKIVNDCDNLEYVGNLEHSSQELFDLFRNSEGFCLPSYQETQPISILEAAFFKKNILIGNGAYSKQEIFKELIKVDPGSINALKTGLLKLKDTANNIQYTIQQQDLNSCLYNSIAKEYIKVYSK